MCDHPKKDFGGCGWPGLFGISSMMMGSRGKMWNPKSNANGRLSGTILEGGFFLLQDPIRKRSFQTFFVQV